ncbi:MAG: beta-lactamase family protein [Candidatus Aminicenantes bacterium]|nr:beta-lactamase family protein [Candidatus Aminicenantes bacterium]
MNRSRAFFTLTTFLIISSNGLATRSANTPNGSKKFGEAVRLLETWIGSVLDFDRLPGMSMAVVHDQEIVYAKGFGYADVSKRIRAVPETDYSICSLSKMFTALAIMQLRDEGKLHLDDPVDQYLPWFRPKIPDPNPTLPTVRDLLRHSGGLPCEPDKTIWPDTADLFPCSECLIERVKYLEMNCPAGTKYNYSNLGYALLGAVVSTLSKVDYKDYIRKNILEPLKLENTTPDYIDYHNTKNMAVGYSRKLRKDSRGEVPVFNKNSMTPAMGLSSNVMDLAEFAMWQFRVLDGKESNGLKKETLQEMHTAQWSDPDWGLGFAIWKMFGKTFVGHQGGCPGYKSQIIIQPEEKIAVVVIVNASDAPQFTLAFAAYNIFSSVFASSNSEKDEMEFGKWEDYVGYYDADISWAAAEVLEWNGSLSVMWLPADGPLNSLIKLQHIEDGIFRQVNSDGTLGKHYIFGTVDGSGDMWMKFNNNQLKKAIR